MLELGYSSIYQLDGTERSDSSHNSFNCLPHPWKKSPVNIKQKAGWASDLVWHSRIKKKNALAGN